MRKKISFRLLEAINLIYVDIKQQNGWEVGRNWRKDEPRSCIVCARRKRTLKRFNTFLPNTEAHPTLASHWHRNDFMMEYLQSHTKHEVNSHLFVPNPLARLVDSTSLSFFPSLFLPFALFAHKSSHTRKKMYNSRQQFSTSFIIFSPLHCYATLNLEKIFFLYYLLS